MTCMGNGFFFILLSGREIYFLGLLKEITLGVQLRSRLLTIIVHLFLGALTCFTIQYTNFVLSRYLDESLTEM